MKKRSKCSICDIRPVQIQGHCYNCHSQIAKLRKDSVNVEPVKYLTYRGCVVGLYPKDNKGNLRAVPLTRSADKLPKAKTLDLNVFCEGYDRDTIKRFKACVLALTSVHLRPVTNKT
jgi:hypothetical protein